MVLVQLTLATPLDPSSYVVSLCFKALSLAPLFQDSLAQTAVDTLSILTKGKTTSCEEQLKKIYCLQKFPSCDDYKEEMKWEKNTTERCFELIDECPEDAKETMKRMQVCEKLSKGQFKIEECKLPIHHITS